MSRQRPNNNVLAGAFLLSGVVLAIVISFVLSGVGDALTPTRDYRVIFSLADGASGLKPGSLVLLGGQPVGKVKAVEVIPEPTEGREVGVEVTISVQSRFKFLANAVFFLERPLLGSFSSVNVTSLGDPSKPGATLLESNGKIRGQLAPPSFLAQAGFGPDQAAEVRAIITDTRKAVARLSEIADKGAPNIDAAITDVRSLTADLRSRLPEWSARIDAISKNLDSATAKLEPIFTNTAGGVDQAREAIAKVDTILAESRPKLASILDSADSAVRKLDTQMVDQVNGALADARRTLDTLTSAASTAAGMIREQAPNIRRALANARLVTDQMKLAAVEIRSQPWRVFYTPSEKENETSVLYDSARSYAQAVSDLRAASESLEATLGSLSAGTGSSSVAQITDRESIERLNGQLKQAFEKYRDAERALLDRLIKNAGNSADMRRPSAATPTQDPGVSESK